MQERNGELFFHLATAKRLKRSHHGSSGCEDSERISLMFVLSLLCVLSSGATVQKKTKTPLMQLAVQRLVKPAWTQGSTLT